MTVTDETAAYFHRIDTTRFRPTSAVQGAWNTREQHIAPTLGLLTHLLETDHRSRNASPLDLARVSFDILGVLGFDEMESSARVIRSGRTIELLEVTLSQGGRTAVIARGWFLDSSDTAGVEGSSLPPMPPREIPAPWRASGIWPGEFVTTVEIRRHEDQPGRAQSWLRPQLPLLRGESTSSRARLLGVVDITNGITPRNSPDELAFPNVDLTAYLFRAPETEWIGFDTTVSYGPLGHGLTHTVIHDERGPIGTVAQMLTLRG
ncbi:thioesterase family protein [Microbacterium sp. EST19A]|uniref:thioesterase family protein n=1 Tax=Microbacterium sp. EST19A TaxID=2862681 RepID=UPI001CBF9F55|nr:thioesterase family protein [Microbacterium sp. EST19A]